MSTDRGVADITQRNMKRLKDEEKVRKRPAVIFGTNDEHGANHGIFEVIHNSIDEAREGHGSKIIITVEKGADGESDIFTVQDSGRGLPMGWNEDEQMYNWELALCELYASGKYDEAQYSKSVGLNGLGLTAMQYASRFMKVESVYDGKMHVMEFERGKPVTTLQVSDDKENRGTGTTIRFQPDVEVFPALKVRKIAVDTLVIALRKQAMLLPGLEIIVNHYDFKESIVFKYKGGISEYIDIVSERRMLGTTQEFFDSAVGKDDTEPAENPDYTVNMRVAFNFSREAGFTEVYHNASHLSERGKSVEGFEKGLVAAFSDYAKEQGKIKKNEKFVYKDISDIMLCVVTSDAPGNRTWFLNQTKKAINNEFIGIAMMKFIYEKMRFWFNNNPALVQKVITEVVANKTAREEAAEVSKKVINKLSKAATFGNMPKGFKDCSSKNVFEKEVYIVEGLSALTSAKLACNPKFQAILAARGKILNCLKEKTTRILKNEIIIDMYRVFGCGMELTEDYAQDIPKFDINKLNWGKIIICTDADIDGSHITTLLLTMFYRLSPSLLKAGKVFIAETPLFEMTCKKETRFAYNEKEKEELLIYFTQTYGADAKVKIQRSKGLGENTAEMMSISTMKPETRRLIPVEYPEDDTMLKDYFDALLGDDIETRRVLIEEYFDQVEALEA
jgi:DNA gyrase subunit B